MQLIPKFRVLLRFRGRSEANTAMLRGIAKYQRMNSPWSVFVDDDAGMECRSAQLWEQKWDGVICGQLTSGMVRMCAERGVPLVDLSDAPSFPGIPQVRPNNLAVGHMAAEDFIERGYRHFAYAGFANALWSGERCAGFIESLALVGRSCAVMESAYSPCDTPDWAVLQAEQLALWLKQQPKPLAVLACHDEMALQVIEAAGLAGLSVPEDLAVLGVNDNRAVCELAQPQLSSIALDTTGAGYLAAEKLAQLMAGGGAGPTTTLLEPMAICTRQSTDILAIENRRIAMALGFVRENACRSITVREVMRHAGVPRHDLERGFRKYIGRSPQAEIRRIQIGEIKRLLLHTDRPLKDIAEATGFEYVEYMCVLFKRLVGETPGRFRRSARAASPAGVVLSLEQPLSMKEAAEAAVG